MKNVTLSISVGRIGNVRKAFAPLMFQSQFVSLIIVCVMKMKTGFAQEQSRY